MMQSISTTYQPRCECMLALSIVTSLHARCKFGRPISDYMSLLCKLCCHNSSGLIIYNPFLYTLLLALPFFAPCTGPTHYCRRIPILCNRLPWMCLMASPSVLPERYVGRNNLMSSLMTGDSLINPTNSTSSSQRPKWRNSQRNSDQNCTRTEDVLAITVRQEFLFQREVGHNSTENKAILEQTLSVFTLPCNQNCAFSRIPPTLMSPISLNFAQNLRTFPQWDMWRHNQHPFRCPSANSF